MSAELRALAAALRRQRLLVLGLPLLTVVLVLVSTLVQPQRYRATSSVLLSRAPITVDSEDTLAYDLPALTTGAPFAREVVAELATQGRQLDGADVQAAIFTTMDARVARISATTADAASADAIADAAVRVLETRGLALWGDTTVMPDRPGVYLVVLQRAPAARANGLAGALLTALLRGAAALGVAVAAALALSYWRSTRPATTKDR